MATVDIATLAEALAAAVAQALQSQGAQNQDVLKELLEKSRPKSDDLTKLITNRDLLKIEELFSDNKSKWPEFNHKFLSHVAGVHPKYRKALEWAEQQKRDDDLTMETLELVDDQNPEIATQLYAKRSPPRGV